MGSVEERTPIEDSGSLSDHEATFQPKRGTPAVETVATAEPSTAIVEKVDAEPPTDLEIAANPNLAYDDAPKEKERHRAKKQQARAEDVPRIKELTRKQKEAEEERDRYKAELEQLKSRPAPQQAPAARVEPPALTNATTFTKPKPKMEDFAGEEDPYEAKVLAVARWEREKERFEQQQQYQETAQRQQVQHVVGRITSQVQAFAAKTPDYAQVVEATKGENVPDLLMATLAAGDKFPELVYYLAQHPMVRHEMHLLTDGKPVTEQNVATVRRLLDARMQAGPTGAAASQVSIVRPPKPPTPVRTGPLKTGDDPPGDGASLADHEQFYSKRRR